MNSNNLSRVQSVFESTFKVEPGSVTSTSVPDDVDGWDSLGHITLGNNLEQEFSISFTIDELMEMENVEAILRIIDGKLSES